MAWERAILPVEEGGIGSPSINLRYEATKVGWLKRWWRPEPDRPDWAWVANELVFQSAHQKPIIAKTTVREWICQSWPIKIRSECLTNSMREMIKAAQKYNASLSVMRVSTDLRLEMPAFYHPFAKNKYLQNNSRVMRCIQDNHKAKTIGDLIRISTEARHDPATVCLHEKPNGNGCRRKARDLLNRIEYKWNPSRETPQKYDLWHTPRRLKRNKNTDPAVALVLFNPDTRSKHSLLGGIRIFSRFPGHKLERKDPFLRTRDPARADNEIEPGGGLIAVSTDGSAI